MANIKEVEVSETTNFSNRKDRRGKPSREFNAMVESVNSFSVQTNISTKEWNETISTRSLTERAYTHPGVAGRLLSSKRRIPAVSQTITKINSIRPNSFFFPKMIEQSSFEERMAGITLFDIEKMPLPLNMEDIKRVTSIFGDLSRRKTASQNLAIQALTAFALESQIENKVPEPLKNLSAKLTDFLDYYTNLTLDMSASTEDTANFVYWLVTKGNPNLPRLLFSYVPASLGISPSSTIKALQQRAEGMHIGADITFRRLLSRSESEIGQAWRRNALPEDLEKHLHYRPDDDKKAEGILEDFYKVKTDEELDHAYSEYDNTSERFAKYFKKILTDVNTADDKRLKFSLPEGNIVSDVTVASQDKRILMFILNFADGRTHLTLEFDQKGSFFGFPYKLAQNNEMVTYAFLKDMMPSFFDMTQKLHPEIERKQSTLILPVPKRIEQPFVAKAAEPYIPRPKEPKPVRARMLSPIAILMREKPMPLGQATQREHIVITSRKKIEEALGRHPRPKDVDRIMQEIKDFEFGRVQAVPIKSSDGSAVRLRVGNLRVILNKLDGQGYSLNSIGDREYAYGKFDRYKD